MADLLNKFAILTRPLDQPGLETTARPFTDVKDPAPRHPELQADLVAASGIWWSRTAKRLTALGSPDPIAHARMLLAHVDGLLIDRLARPDPAVDVAGGMRLLLDGMVVKLPSDDPPKEQPR